MRTVKQIDVSNASTKCKVLDCTHPKRVGKATGSSKKKKRRNHAFCSHHVGFKAQMSKKNYDELKQSNNMWIVI